MNPKPVICLPPDLTVRLAGMPDGARAWPPREGVEFCFSVGKKCFVRNFSGNEGEWIEAGAHQPAGDDHFPQGTAINDNEARVYYRKSDSTVRIILPNDAPFRASRKGLVNSRTLSFDQHGQPLPEVRLLYALKTGLRESRFWAIESWPEDLFEGRTFGEKWKNMSTIAESPHLFLDWASSLIAPTACATGGLTNWTKWERIADDAAEFTRRRIAVANGEALPDNHELFLKAVKKATVEGNGLPNQRAVRKAWEESGGNGRWEGIRKTFGFEWIPTLQDWKKGWQREEG